MAGLFPAMARNRLGCACGVRRRLGEYHSPIETRVKASRLRALPLLSDGDGFAGATPQEKADGLAC